MMCTLAAELRCTDASVGLSSEIQNTVKVSHVNDAGHARNVGAQRVANRIDLVSVDTSASA